MALVSMGNYIFSTEPMIEALEADAKDPDSVRDFGKNIIPSMYKTKKVYAYDFKKNRFPGQTKAERGYWVDVGTIDAYWEASMDLINVSPTFNQFNKKWPIYTLNTDNAPAKFVFADEFIGHGKRQRFGVAIDSIISNGCILSGGRVQNSVLSPDVRVKSYSYVTQSVLMEGVEIGRYAKIRNAIIDKGIHIPPHKVIGYNLEQDKRLYAVTPSGIVVVPKNAIF